MPDNGEIRFGPIKLLLDYGAEKCPQWFLFFFSESEPKEAPVQRSLRVINAGYYEGLVTFGDRKRLLGVVDADANGLYSDAFQSIDCPGDIFLIDRNGDGKLDASYRSEETQPLGRSIWVGDRYWQLEVASDGSAITVEPLDKPLGTLRPAGVQDYTMLLLGDQGVLLRPAAKRARSGCRRARTACSPVTTRLPINPADNGIFPARLQRQARVEVSAHGEVKLPLGPPFVPRVLTSQSAGELILSLDLRGGGGETYSDVRIGDYERPPAPRSTDS